MPDISAAIRNAVGEKIAEMQKLADQLEDILHQGGLAQRRGSHKDSRCEDNEASPQQATGYHKEEHYL